MVLGLLDTVTDFVGYLEKKERFILSGRLAHAYGDEDLLAFYLKDVNANDEHDFIVPQGAEMIALEEGHFQDLIRRPEFTRKVAADRVSLLRDPVGWPERFLITTVTGRRSAADQTLTGPERTAPSVVSAFPRTKPRAPLLSSQVPPGKPVAADID